MKTLIVEDEKFAADRLEKVLLEINPSIKIVGKTASVKETVQWLMVNQADLIFLDIQLSDGLSFSIFEHLSIITPVIFTTAYDQFSIKAFELNSIDYLLKPIRKKDLEDALYKLNQMKSMFHYAPENFAKLLQQQEQVYKERFLVQYGDKLVKVDANNITCFYALSKNVFMCTFEGSEYPVDYSLDKLEELLNPNIFFRVNRKYLINIKSIDKMVSWSRSRVKIDLNPKPGTNEDIVVSIERSADFKQWLNA